MALARRRLPPARLFAAAALLLLALQPAGARVTRAVCEDGDQGVPSAAACAQAQCEAQLRAEGVDPSAVELEPRAYQGEFLAAGAARPRCRPARSVCRSVQ